VIRGNAGCCEYRQKVVFYTGDGVDSKVTVRGAGLVRSSFSSWMNFALVSDPRVVVVDEQNAVGKVLVLEPASTDRADHPDRRAFGTAKVPDDTPA
jgi:hypothetical protein